MERQTGRVRLILVYLTKTFSPRRERIIINAETVAALTDYWNTRTGKFQD